MPYSTPTTGRSFCYTSGSMSARTEKFKPSTDLLYPLIALVGFVAFISLRPLPPNDFWWHLKIGELIATQRVIPTTNLFAWSLPTDQPFFYAQWLGELLLYGIFRTGGVALVIFTRNLLVALTFWLVAAEAKRQSGSWRLAALVLILSGTMSMNNLVVRPQIFAWLPFLLLLIILLRFTDGQLRARWLLLCPLLMIFWVNVHGSFVLGLVLLGAFTIGEGLRRLLGWDGARNWREVGQLAGVATLTGLAVLLNPRGVGIFEYVRNLMGDSAIQKLIVEWQPPTPQGFANLAFFGSILLLLLVFFFSRYRPTPTQALLVLGFLWLAWTGQRHIIWYGFVSLPILARAMADLPMPKLQLTSQRNWLNLALIVVLAVPLLLVQPWLIEKLPLPEAYWEMVHRRREIGPMVTRATPLDAAEYLRENPGGKLFTELGQSSYLIWAVPEQGVFIDPRIELFPAEQWEDYISMSKGVDYVELFAKYGVDRVLLDMELQPGLAEALAADADWQREYQDDRTEIWGRE